MIKGQYFVKQREEYDMMAWYRFRMGEDTREAKRKAFVEHLLLRHQRQHGVRIASPNGGKWLRSPLLPSFQKCQVPHLYSVLRASLVQSYLAVCENCLVGTAQGKQ